MCPCVWERRIFKQYYSACELPSTCRFDFAFPVCLLFLNMASTCRNSADTHTHTHTHTHTPNECLKKLSCVVYAGNDAPTYRDILPSNSLSLFAVLSHIFFLHTCHNFNTNEGFVGVADTPFHTHEPPSDCDSDHIY